MDTQLLQRLTASRVDKYSYELELAIENHRKWLARLHRTLICHTDPDPNDLAEAPHLLCHFGRWYHNIDNPRLQELPEFIAIEEVHTQLHLRARDLLHKGQAREAISSSEYDELITLSERLWELITQLQGGFKHNLNLISKLTGTVFENAKEGVIITDPSGTILNVNKAFCRVTGYSLEEVVGKNPRLLHSGHHPESFYQQMWQALANEGQWQGEIWNRRKNGDVYLEWLSIAAVLDDEGRTTHYVGIFSDLTSQKESEERLYHLAHYDILTDLPNRMLMQDTLRQALLRAKRHSHIVAVMFLDLDGFKVVNDTYGHSEGDRLLQKVAKRLGGCLRQSDTVARFGGDEFTIIIPDLESTEGLETVAQKIIDTIAVPVPLGDHEGHVTTSIGISFYPGDGVDVDTLIKRADIAMYYAKNHGKNQFRFYNQDLGPF